MYSARSCSGVFCCGLTIFKGLGTPSAKSGEPASNPIITIGLRRRKGGRILETPLEQSGTNHLPYVKLFVVEAGDPNPVTHDAVLEAYDRDLDMGSLIVHDERGVSAGRHRDFGICGECSGSRREAGRHGRGPSCS